MSDTVDRSDRGEKFIDAGEVQRLIGLAHGLVAGTVKMTEGDLLRERIKIKDVLLPPTHTEAVYGQICEVGKSRNPAAIRFAIAVLAPLVGTQPLSSTQLEHLLSALRNSWVETADAAYSLCQRNACEMERIVAQGWSSIEDAIGVYRATRSPLVLGRLIEEVTQTLAGDRYQPEHYLPSTKLILSAVLENPPEHPSLRDVLLGLLRSSKPCGPLREDLQKIVAQTADIKLLLPLLLAFQADLTSYLDSWRTVPSMAGRVVGIRDRQEQLLTSFPSSEAAAVRSLFEILRDCQALPYRSDHARLELRRRAVAPAATILERAADVLADFADVFAADDAGRTDIVYIICCLPRQRVGSFLRSMLQHGELSISQHAAFALALSYAAGEALPNEAKDSLLLPQVDDSARTWLGAESVENMCHKACTRASNYLGRIFESSSKSHEERLTGIFLVKLQTELQHWAEGVEPWAAKQFGRYSHVHCSYEDVAAKGPEKVWGADVGFYLSVHANGVLKAERAFLAQVKKARLSATGHELSWTIDKVQRDILIGQSSWSVYLFYGCYKNGNAVRVAPASAVRDVMAGAAAKSQISASNAVNITRPFAEFFTYEFLADWWGDCDGRALDIVRGRVEDFPVRALFSIDVNLGMAG